MGTDFLSEWTKRQQNDIPLVNKPLAASGQWYVAAGWRLEKLTPMVCYGDYKPGIQLISPPGNYHSFSEILRYELVRNVALKVQASTTEAGNTRYWVTPNFASRNEVTVFSLGVDFVF